MFNITWDKQTGGVKLSTKVEKETLGISPRPVFYEELDLLKLDELGWTYPRCEQPLLWAVNKKYYYRAEYVFEAKGANLYDAPTVNFAAGKEKLKLKPVDVAGMLRKNQDFMFLLESEAIEFIRDVFVQYSSASKSVERVKANQIDFEALKERVEKRTKTKMAIVREDCDSFDIMPLEQAEKRGKREYKTTKIDKFIASFSGGKDSQVILDLCTRAIAPTDFEVIYSDTGYELPPSLELYDKVEKYYKEKFPKLKFTLARNHESVLNYWDKIGTPSDTHRWCCTVMKTAPLYRTLKVEGTNRQAKVITFDGVRAEESTKRSTYNRIGKGVKHHGVINASPILRWSSVEIFLYLFKWVLPINQAYRTGMTRVGCLICPFSSEWNDMIAGIKFNDELKPFIERIKHTTNKAKIQDADVYIKKGNWKRRAGGRDIQCASALEIIQVKPDLTIIIRRPQRELSAWFSAVSEYAGNSVNGEFKFKDKIFPYKTEKLSDGAIKITFIESYRDPIFQGLIKRALYKATFCIECEACEVECPTGALTILPEPRIDYNTCIHCNKCLTFHELGCIAAHSLKITQQNGNSMKLISYNNFGLNEEWLDYFMQNSEDYFTNTDHGLNIKEQLPSFVKWLTQSGIIHGTKDKNITPLGRSLINLFKDQPTIVWEIIWINLVYESPISNWYSCNVSFGLEFSEAGVSEQVKNDYPNDNPTTIKNIVYALFRTFKESPIGEEIHQCSKCGKNSYVRNPYSDITLEGVAYSLYKYGQTKGISSFRVSDLYRQEENCGIYREFGISQEDLKKKLRALSTDNNRVIIAELNMGLDHITLRDDLTPLTALQLLLED